jgi:hypothetical protein
MFERFSDKARRSVVLAQEEARRLNHNYIGTEHILLGLLHEGEGIAAESLRSLGLSLEAARAKVDQIVGHGDEPPSGHIPFTPRAKKVLELSLREALQLGHNYIGTEHILLGLLREREGVAAKALVRVGLDLGTVRQRALELAESEGARERERAPGVVPGTLAPPGVLSPPGVLPIRRVERPELLRVVPLGREVALPDGERLVLISLELWSEWTTLRTAVVAAPGSPLALASDSLASFRLADAAGTSYELTGGATSGAAWLRYHQAVFQPSPPAGTERLTLTAVAADGSELPAVEIDLAGGAAAGTG